MLSWGYLLTTPEEARAAFVDVLLARLDDLGRSAVSVDARARAPDLTGRTIGDDVMNDDGSGGMATEADEDVAVDLAAAPAASSFDTDEVSVGPFRGWH
jgi:hypothetical protein